MQGNRLFLGWLSIVIFILPTLIHALAIERPNQAGLPPRSLNDTDLPHLFKRTTLFQENDFYQLNSISQLRGQPTRFKKPYPYHSDPVSGDGITAFVIDSGVDPKNPEIKKLIDQGKLRWLIPQTIPPGHTREENDPLDHGTCVASLIGGETYGVVKNLKEVVVVKIAAVKLGLFAKMKKKIRGHEDLYARNLLEALELVKQYIIDHHLEGTSVVNMSFSLRRSIIDVFPACFEGELQQLMVDLGQMAAVFLAAGNQNALQEDRIADLRVVSTYPQLFHNQVPGMTLVGMATQKGIQSKLSKAVPRNGLWAIGERVKCASTKRRGWDWKVGTSVASPLAAGLAADEMALLLRSHPEYRDRFSDEVETRRFLDNVLGKMFQQSWIRPGADASAKKHQPAVPLISNQPLNEIPVP